MLATLLVLASETSAACLPMGTEPRYEAVAGAYDVTPVRQTAQRPMLKRLDGRSIVALSRKAATLATGKALHARHYYLVRAGYVAEPRMTGIVPGSLALSVDVDKNGVAYVTSFILSHQNGSAAVAVIVTSQKAITRAVAVCGAAE